MKICIFGPGFLGARLSQSLPDTTLSRVDVTDPVAITQELERLQPDAVINAAGKTGTPNVDWCESHQAETYRSNVIGALQLATACAEKKIYLLHLASGCVFYGPSPSEGGWREDDPANPLSFYSRTKYAADLILSRMSNVGIARLRMPIDAVPGPRNLITKLASYSRVVDVENSVTVVSDLVLVVQQLVEKRAEGVFHVTNPGTMRHQRLLALYRELVEPAHRYELISEQELLASGLVVKQRSNCILSSQNLQSLGVSMRPIEEALQDTMRQYAKNKVESTK